MENFNITVDEEGAVIDGFNGFDIEGTEEEPLFIDEDGEQLEVSEESPTKKEEKVDPNLLMIEEEEEEDGKGFDEQLEEVTEHEEANPISLFTKSLVDKEILTGLEEDEISSIESEEDLFEAVKESSARNIEAILEKFDNTHHGIISFLSNGGTPEEFAKEYKTVGASILNINEDSITEDNHDILTKIADTYFKKTTKMSDKMRQKAVSNLVEVDGADEVKELFNELKRIDAEEKKQFAEQNKEKVNKQKEQNAAINKSIKDGVENTTEFIPGRKVDKKTRENIYNSIGDVMQKINSDPSKYYPALAFLNHYNLLDGDFSKIIKEAKTKQAGEFTKSLQNSKGHKKAYGRTTVKKEGSLYRDAMNSIK